MVTYLRNNEHLNTQDMGKGICLIAGNTKKVGNTVGFRNSASNNGQTQGYRVYQPVVKNPQTAAQAEQRAKTAAVNATYSKLKMIIDRGNESLPYGNRARCAWLKKAFRNGYCPWYQKGETPLYPVLCELTHGTLQGLTWRPMEDNLMITCPGVTSGGTDLTVGQLSQALLDAYPHLKEGDQITFVSVGDDGFTMVPMVTSFLLDVAEREIVEGTSTGSGIIMWEPDYHNGIFSVIISRKGSGNKHLRTTSSLKGYTHIESTPPYDETSMKSAIASYQTSQSANTDWAEDNT